MIALVALGCLAMPACAAKSGPAAERRSAPATVYIFPLTLPDRTLICAERHFEPDPPCMTLGQFRSIVKATEAN